MAGQDDCDCELSADGAAGADGMVCYARRMETFTDAWNRNFRGTAAVGVLAGGAAAKRNEANKIS